MQRLQIALHVCSWTFLQQTRVSLRKWVLAIGFMVNAKKSLSNCQLTRHLELTQMKAYYTQQWTRMVMANNNMGYLLDMVEADEANIGGKKRNPSKRDDDKPHSGGSGQDGSHRHRRVGRRGPGHAGGQGNGRRHRGNVRHNGNQENNARFHRR